MKRNAEHVPHVHVFLDVYEWQDEWQDDNGYYKTEHWSKRCVCGRIRDTYTKTRKVHDK